MVKQEETIHTTANGGRTNWYRNPIALSTIETQTNELFNDVWCFKAVVVVVGANNHEITLHSDASFVHPPSNNNRTVDLRTTICINVYETTINPALHFPVCHTIRDAEEKYFHPIITPIHPSFMSTKTRASFSFTEPNNSFTFAVTEKQTAHSITVLPTGLSEQGLAAAVTDCGLVGIAFRLPQQCSPAAQADLSGLTMR